MQRTHVFDDGVAYGVAPELVQVGALFVTSLVPISSLYGLMASSRRSNPFSPEMRMCFGANRTWGVVMDSILSALYAGPSRRTRTASRARTRSLGTCRG